MTTPAQKAGIVVGKSYKVTSTEAPHYDGGVYELTGDDGSDLPYFQLVPGFDGPQDKEACIWVNGIADTVLTEVEAEPAAAQEQTVDLTYRIESNKDETNIYVRKQLTLAQIKRIMDILGE